MCFQIVAVHKATAEMVKKKCNDFKREDSSTESNEDAKDHVAAGSSCVHVKKSVNSNQIRKRLKATKLEKQCIKCFQDKTINAEAEGDELEQDTSLWICLKCATQLCGRAHNKHALEHAKTSFSDPHNLAMNTRNFQVWCYECDEEVNPKAMARLVECVEMVKREANKVDETIPSIANIEQTIRSAAGSIKAVMGDGLPIPIASGSTITNTTMGIGNQPCFNNTNSITTATPLTTPTYRDIRLDTVGGKKPAVATIVDSLPRVRGLSNLGNTCFFNAVLQCLARTPYLLEVLQETRLKGEYIQLPGGTLKLKDGTEKELSPVSGELKPSEGLTVALANTLAELQAGGCGVYSPGHLLMQLTNKWPQFAGADQHDSHELLRRLLESVRSEDLRRYQTVILLHLVETTNVDPQTVGEVMKETIKFFGRRASDRILCPEPVFRGFLVSTLTCQDCHHVSSRHESFLDISLPVSVEKPQPPIRRKSSPEPDYTYSAASASATKPLSNRERRRVRKADKAAAKQSKNLIIPHAPTDPNASSAASGGGDAESVEDDDGMSDADVEDNLTDDSQPKKAIGGADQNGNQHRGAVVGPEKRDDTPENPNKEEVGEGNVVCELALSAEGMANMMEKLAINNEQQDEPDGKKAKTRRQRTYSHADWGSTLAPRYQCEDNECSIQSCFNAFTAVELMTGNNKVCCDACTERINGKGGKSVNTIATKQFLVSSPPAVLILHLKRFQVDPRGMLRKITKEVTFPSILDIAPFCGSKVKTLPNVKRGQKKLLYSLYGIVEHSGTMHGGHYVAYVKVRPQLPKEDARWDFLPKGTKAELDQEDEQAMQLERELAKERARQMTSNVTARDSDDALTSSSSASSRSSTGTTTDGEEEGAVGYTPKPETLPDVDPPPGRWYYVSDSHVRETTEKNALSAQAYLLFYERIF